MSRKVNPVTFDPPLSILQTASALNISRTAVYNLLKSGEMTSVKLNNKTLIRSSEVERYFASLPQAKFQPPWGQAGRARVTDWTEPFQAELAQVSASVLAALGSVQAAAGDERAALAAGILVQLATHFMLHSIGPQAARQALVVAYAALEQDIAGLNGNSATLS
jgi:excisionase family DNA binding protein